MPSLPLVSDQYQRRWSSEQSRKSTFYDVNRHGPNPPGASKTASARSTTLTAIFVGLVPSGVNYGRAHHYENQANRRPRNQDWGDTCDGGQQGDERQERGRARSPHVGQKSSFEPLPDELVAPFTAALEHIQASLNLNASLPPVPL
jgi:hypothetical protein